MTIDPTRIDKDQLHELRHSVARAYDIDPHRQYGERAAAALLIPPGERRNASGDVSTLKRKRRAGKIPHVPLGDGSVAYLGLMLCDFLAFGERSILLWGGDPGSIPADPEGGPAPHQGNGGGRKHMAMTGASDGPVHQA
ncbi:hypothetical protein MKK63_28005 [Methylobacterium sp. J-088]|uniref:hypothetical protein n=1 Tax=unclassified Methylobacterium TaxID=2615210 RepID=UPI0011C705AD|nr:MULTISPECIES: hypothetical protein [unclassified Methylobacterium]MCJ2066509.1 hypothetical protein [Methylobacterium sp. J-088]TXN01307.1 hypothetical protein FV242_18985 [Methylobacterium sp. WL64]